MNADRKSGMSYIEVITATSIFVILMWVMNTVISANISVYSKISPKSSGMSTMRIHETLISHLQSSKGGRVRIINSTSSLGNRNIYLNTIVSQNSQGNGIYIETGNFCLTEGKWAYETTGHIFRFIKSSGRGQMKYVSTREGFSQSTVGGYLFLGKEETISLDVSQGLFSMDSGLVEILLKNTSGKEYVSETMVGE